MRIRSCRFLMLPALLGLLMIPVAQAGGKHDHDEARQALEAGAILPLPRILAQVAQPYPGQVLDVELEQEDGRWIYEIKLLQSDGRFIKLDVDARSGVVLGLKRKRIRPQGDKH